MSDLQQRVSLANPERELERLCSFVRQVLRRQKRKGAVVGLSGGIDSTVAAALAVRAVGKQRTFGVILPEKDSSPESALLGHEVAKSLEIEAVEHDITPVLEALGCYSLRDAAVAKAFGGHDPSWPIRLRINQGGLTGRTLNFFELVRLRREGDGDGVEEVVRPEAGALAEIMAATNFKQRVRMIRIYHEAERRHFAVVGTTNRLEMAQGFFVKHGDGGVDLEPLAHLYKGQVFDLGRHLGVPEEVLSRPPSPDTYPDWVTDREFFFRMDHLQADLVLAGHETGASAEEVARAAGIELEEARRAVLA